MGGMASLAQKTKSATSAVGGAVGGGISTLN